MESVIIKHLCVIWNTKSYMFAKAHKNSKKTVISMLIVVNIDIYILLKLLCNLKFLNL